MKEQRSLVLFCKWKVTTLGKKAKALWQRPPVLKISVETPYVIINTVLDPKGGEIKTKIAKLLLHSLFLPSLKFSLWQLVGGMFSIL